MAELPVNNIVRSAILLPLTQERDAEAASKADILGQLQHKETTANASFNLVNEHFIAAEEPAKTQKSQIVFRPETTESRQNNETRIQQKIDEVSQQQYRQTLTTLQQESLSKKVGLQPTIHNPHSISDQVMAQKPINHMNDQDKVLTQESQVEEELLSDDYYHYRVAIKTATQNQLDQSAEFTDEDTESTSTTLTMSGDHETSHDTHSRDKKTITQLMLEAQVKDASQRKAHPDHDDILNLETAQPIVDHVALGKREVKAIKISTASIFHETKPADQRSLVKNKLRIKFKGF